MRRRSTTANRSRLLSTYMEVTGHNSQAAADTGRHLYSYGFRQMEALFCTKSNLRYFNEPKWVLKCFGKIATDGQLRSEWF